MLQRPFDHGFPLGTQPPNMNQMLFSIHTARDEEATGGIHIEVCELGTMLNFVQGLGSAVAPYFDGSIGETERHQRTAWMGVDSDEDAIPLDRLDRRLRIVSRRTMDEKPVVSPFPMPQFGLRSD